MLKLMPAVLVMLLVFKPIAHAQPQNLQVLSINNVQYADQQTGADMCAKISTAIGILLQNFGQPGAPMGGTVDARGFQGVQACGSNPFAGLNSKGAINFPINLLIGATKITTTAPWEVTTNGVHIECQGALQSQIQYTGTTGARGIIIFDPSNSTSGTSMQDFQINNCGIHTAGLAADGILLQGWHHNKIEGDSIWGVTNCGLHTQFAVVNTMKGIHVSGGDALHFSFSGSAPPFGLCFDQLTSASFPTTASTVIDPIIEGTTKVGINLMSAAFMVITGGTSESGHSGFAIGAGSYSNTIINTDFEANTTPDPSNPNDPASDGKVDGYNNNLIGIIGTNVLRIQGMNNYIIGGGLNNISILSGAKNTYINSTVGNNFGTLQDAGTATHVDRLFNFVSQSVTQGWNGFTTTSPSLGTPLGCVNFVDNTGQTRCVPYY